MKQKTYFKYLKRCFPILIFSFISSCYSQNNVNTGLLKEAENIYFVKNCNKPFGSIAFSISDLTRRKILKIVIIDGKRNNFKANGILSAKRNLNKFILLLLRMSLICFKFLQ